MNALSAPIAGRPTGGDLVAAALDCATRGWAVFPLAAGDKVPPRGWAWTRDHTRDPATIRAWWARAPLNIGIACGPSGLLGIDLDVPKHPTDHPSTNLPELADLADVAALDPATRAAARVSSRILGRGPESGADVLAIVCARARQPWPPETFTVRTRRGGWHLYYRQPDPPAGRRLGNTTGGHGTGLGWLIDTRGTGGYLVGPGSHVALPDGTGTYAIVRDLPPAVLPAWLADALTPPATCTRSLPGTAGTAAGSGPVGDTARRREAYLAAVIRAETGHIAGAAEHGRNNALYIAAVNLGRLVAGGALDEGHARQVLVTAAAGHLAAGAYSPRQAHATITSGLRAGTLRPRHLEPPPARRTTRPG